MQDKKNVIVGLLNHTKLYYSPKQFIPEQLFLESCLSVCCLYSVIQMQCILLQMPGVDIQK